jgi:glutaredoxin-like YruB-family protein
MAKVIVYTKDDCPWCVKVEDFLKQNNVPFEERNAQRNPSFAQEVLKLSGGAAVPVTEIDGTIILGFNVKKIREALKIA